MTNLDPDQSPILNYDRKLELVPARGGKWLMLTVAGWLLVIIGGAAGLVGAGGVVLLYILEIRSSRAGNTLVDNTQFYLGLGSRAFLGCLMFLAGIWLLRRRRQAS